MRPTTMAGSSAAEDSGTITTAVRNKHTSNPIHFILLICNPSLFTVFAAIVITITVFVIVVPVVIMAVTVVVTTWTPNPSHCNDQHYNGVSLPLLQKSKGLFFFSF